MDHKSAGSEKKIARNKIATAKRFRCKVGGEWKEVEDFSERQHKMMQQQVKFGKAIDPAQSGMTCKEHSAGSLSHLTCDLCCLRKPLEEFSKTSRKNGDFTCKRCTAWVETQEPDVTPAPLETGHVSAEERAGEVWSEEFLHDSDFFGDDGPLQRSLDLEKLAIGPELEIAASIYEPTPSIASTTESSASAMSHIPPHLRKRLNKAQPTDLASTSSTSSMNSVSEESNSSKQLPPHLRAKMASGSSHRTLINSCDSASISTATTVREEKQSDKHPRVVFNAWDPLGIRHTVVKSATSSSSMTEASSRTGGRTEPGWETPSEKRVVRIPAGGNKSNGGVRGKGKGRWPRGSECRIPQAELRRQERETCAPAPRRPPGKDRERIVCCEPDDDDDEE